MTLTYIIAAILLAINIYTFTLYGADKWFAIKHHRRIPEKKLLRMAIYGGAFGALAGMIIFHHKTRKPKFWFYIGISTTIYLGLITILAIKFTNLF